MSLSPFTQRPVSGRTLGEYLTDIWATACETLGAAAEQRHHATRELQRLLPDWADDRIEAAPRETSYVADDGFPAEVSANWSGPHPELRMLFDCLSDVPPRIGASDPRWNLWSGSSMFTSISPLFRQPPAAPLWHSMAWRAPDPPAHKVYFGLYGWPVARRYAIVEQAMQLMGLERAWAHARHRIENGARYGSREIEFVGLDIGDSSVARVKIYYRHQDVDIAELNRVASVALQHDEGRALSAYRMLTAGRDHAGAAPLTCLAFRSGHQQAVQATTYLRMPSLTTCEQESVERTAALLGSEGVPPQRFVALTDAFAPRRADGGRGVLELVSHRAGRSGDVTTYFRFPTFAQQSAVPVATAHRA
ncbi:hypothetical protein [Actinocatenispora comari]|uniref:Uncharacterized protein n=1 Tax=Actinocatenispora comari TaxID=2807577 RepID=A0A8J4AAM3_9ACTN|nr:hypothetical protein [Actinocatenispora comari]GIL27403.1 hypothetical protein NUM_26570 [Actinocatenispora comari]